MGRRIYNRGYRRRGGSQGFFSVLAALIVLSLTGAGAVVFPLFLVLVGVVALILAVFALRLVAEMVCLVVRAMTS
ncbi:MAG: hypothetical protein ACREEY_07215 [Brevundimonas sp.]